MAVSLVKNTLSYLYAEHADSFVMLGDFLGTLLTDIYTVLFPNIYPKHGLSLTLLLGL